MNEISSTTLTGLKWRSIGPSRGGRVVAVAGDFNNPMTFYFGACAGGIWKTTDGGNHWRCVSDGFLTTAAVGAIAVARSDSNVVYAGMGETTNSGLDVSYGDGGVQEHRCRADVDQYRLEGHEAYRADPDPSDQP